VLARYQASTGKEMRTVPIFKAEDGADRLSQKVNKGFPLHNRAVD